MTGLMTGPLGLVLVTAVMWWGITFNQRLKERYHCTACTFWGVTGGFVGTFCWMLLLGTEKLFFRIFDLLTERRPFHAVPVTLSEPLQEGDI